MPRLVPNSCREERITLGTYERGLLKEYIQFEKDKNIQNNLTKVATTTITGISTVAASLPLIIGAWIAKEVVTDEDVKDLGSKAWQWYWEGNLLPTVFGRGWLWGKNET
jgi:hypothetical protein